MTKLLTVEEIKRAAAMAAKHAEERALLSGRQENERRELAALQQAEAKTLLEAPAPAPPAAPKSSSRKR